MAFLLRPPGSVDSLPETLADLGRSRKSVAVTSGVLAFVATAVGLAFLACVLDAGFELPPLIRAFALVAVLAASGVVWIRGVSRALRLRTDPLAVAMELESRHPGLNDSLASAVSFLEADDAESRGVSPALQAVAVRQARRAAGLHDFDRLVPTGPCWARAWACAAVFAAAVPVILVAPATAAVAVVRLADPFGAHTWPTQTAVEVTAPAEFPYRLALGKPFDFAFAVRGVVPDRATVTVQFDGGAEFEEQYPLAAGNDPLAPDAATVSARFEPGRVRSSFSFRVAANDFTSEWMRVEVVPPPRLVSFPGSRRPTPQFRIMPPPYTGLPEVDLDLNLDLASSRSLAVPAGTVVRVRAVSDVPLESAVLAYLGNRTAATHTAGVAALGHLNPFAAVGMQGLAAEVAADVPLTLDETGTQMSATFQPSASGDYEFRLTDRSGMTGTRPLSIRVRHDPPPTVTLVRPSYEQDPPVLTPVAGVLVRVAASDKEYAVRRVFLEYRVGNDGPVRKLPLIDVRDAERVLPLVVGGWGVTARVRPVAADGERIVPLSAFTRDGTTPLREGDTLFLRGAADDWDDVTPGKGPGRGGWDENPPAAAPGRSAPVVIVVAAPAWIEAWLDQELTALRDDITAARDQQREARQKAAEVRPQPDGRIAAPERGLLLASEQLQMLINGRVGDSRAGLRARADRLQEVVRVNQLSRSNTTDRVAVVARTLGRLADHDAPVITPALAAARQFGAQPPQPGQVPQAGEKLSLALRHQKAIEYGLTDLLDLLSVWGGAVEIRGEARALRDFIRLQSDDVQRMDRDATPDDLDRAGNRADTAATRANALLGNATALAAKKDQQAVELRAAADTKERDATALRAKATALPPGTPAKSEMNARAAERDNDAVALRADADRAAAEAVALRKGVTVAAGGQALPNDLIEAGRAIRKDRRADTLGSFQSADTRLAKLIEALDEQEEAAPDLKKLQERATGFDELAAAQDDIRHRAAEAARIADPAARAAALRNLAAEQDRLIERGREFLHRLDREHAQQEARAVRAALDRMEAARADLEHGEPGIPAQNDAIQLLDGTRDRLDAAAASAPERLADEKRRKLADRVKALLDRQKAAVAEVDRLHKLVTQNKGWGRDEETAYLDVPDRERGIAKEVESLQQEFAGLPVLDRVLADAVEGMNTAADRITERIRDFDPALEFAPELESANDRRVRRPMDLAMRRLEQLLQVLSEKPPEKKSNGAATPSEKKEPGPKDPKEPPPPAGDRDLVPPKAQLKVLRALQAEVNEQTAAFDKLHPDRDALDDDAREELKQLEAAQRDIAALFEQMAALFKEQTQDPGDGDKDCRTEPVVRSLRDRSSPVTE